MSDATKLCPTCQTAFPTPAGVAKGRTARYCSQRCRPSRFQRAKCGPVDQAPPQPALETNAATCARIYTTEEAELLCAVEAFKKRAKVKFPTACQVFAILVGLGYKRGAVGSEAVT